MPFAALRAGELVLWELWCSYACCVPLLRGFLSCIFVSCKWPCSCQGEVFPWSVWAAFSSGFLSIACFWRAMWHSSPCLHLHPSICRILVLKGMLLCSALPYRDFQGEEGIPLPSASPSKKGSFHRHRKLLNGAHFYGISPYFKRSPKI